ncbi:hypothetical protein SERLADRAFT_462513 [Serpula lacrymans var. lacrymans S7.9]|uniref:Probable methionine--tRNA ligase, mitochondrial n=1 Tax=Serpula lacrymans var. lacrymans (strain S7.9) TaxID=578457 RepID=F8NNW3_SERL9|nr:uncharacterized protein SERLADRAFT_462513 [Serpula lacrymans var. lacrymans S7.9]EGO28063.1 hypothetical protein SERLADRAFT_462513 [Serpula lacrymans var. lacrymans S7.9]
MLLYLKFRPRASLLPDLTKTGAKRISVSLPRPYTSKSLENQDAKSYYITTPIFYPNAVPHIGHLYSLVAGDILARFARLSDPNRPVSFLAGTDEHGLKIQKAAKDQGLEPKVLCDKLSQQFRNLAARANVSNTIFLRTTEDAHHKAVEDIWHRLNTKGLIYKGSYEGWYSVSDECFYTDTQVTKSSIPGGDVMVSIETGSVVEWSAEENYKFRLSAFRDSLLAHYVANKDAIFPPSYHARIIDSLSSEPLEDLSISRPRSRLSWGIPVPGDPGHTIYVWFDALTVYLTGLGYPWKTAGINGHAEGWPPNVQVIGKDILRFHAIYFPAMLQALNLPLSRTLLSHAHWTVQQRKMSKSVGNVADPFEAMDTFGVDVVRFYLARVGGRFRDDVDWSHDQLEKHGEEIRSLLGNFFLRITSKAIQSRIASASPLSVHQLTTQTYSGEDLLKTGNIGVLTSLRELGPTVRKNIGLLEVGDALDAIILCLKQANAAMTHIGPWAREPEVAQASYVTSMETLRLCAICLQPFIPSTAGRLLEALGVPLHERTLQFAELGAGKVGEGVKGVKLFPPAHAKKIDI